LSFSSCALPRKISTTCGAIAFPYNSSGSRVADEQFRSASVLYTAYFDEADTHGPEPTVIMASFLGTARQWELFGRRLHGLQHRNGFTIFHATEFKNKTGEFAGWSDWKCLDLVHDLTVLVRDNLTEGVTIHLERLRYEEEYRKPPIPKRMSLDSQYGVCFRACMAHLIAIVLRDGKPNLPSSGYVVWR
jgi:hypothetical protein